MGAHGHDRSGVVSVSRRREVRDSGRGIRLLKPPEIVESECSSCIRLSSEAHYSPQSAVRKPHHFRTRKIASSSVSLPLMLPPAGGNVDMT